MQKYLKIFRFKKKNNDSTKKGFKLGNKLQKNTQVIERFMEEQDNIFTNKLEITTILEYIYLDAIERKKQQ